MTGRLDTSILPATRPPRRSAGFLARILNLHERPRGSGTLTCYRAMASPSTVMATVSDLAPPSRVFVDRHGPFDRALE